MSPYIIQITLYSTVLSTKDNAKHPVLYQVNDSVIVLSGMLYAILYLSFPKKTFGGFTLFRL